MGASLEVDAHPVGVAVGHSCKVVVSLSAGEHSVVNPSASLTPEDASYLGLSEFPIAREPTLDQLNQFAESLRGKKVTLYASAKGSFAHHLSSYLTAWGMDVSHISAEGAAEGEDQGEDIAEPPQSSNVDLSTIKPGTASTQPSPPSPNTSLRASPDPISFTLIDDDVNVLRSRLQKLKMDQAYPLHLSVRKRPSLASNHRPRSSPQVARVMGVPQLSAASSSHTVIVHFTSLANFKLVKEAIQSCLLPINGTPMKVPEVIVVPKPAGPRRFLTALHTAVSKPVVDPFFAPIATSPISPGIHSISPFFGLSNAPRSPSGKSTTSARSDRSNRSPKEYGEPPHVSASPMGVTEGLGYFPNTSFRMGSSPSGGLLISSPNGPPAGIFFVPKKSSMGAPPSPLMERDRPQEAEGRSRGTSFRMPPATQEISPGRTDANLTALSTLPEVTRPSPPTGLSMASNGSDSKGKGRATQTPVNEPSPITSNEPSPAIPDALPSSVEPSPQPAPRLSSRRSSQQSASPPVSPTRPVAGTGTRRMSRRAAAAAVDSQPAGLFSVSKKPKGAGDNAIVPPISVLIVDGE